MLFFVTIIMPLTLSMLVMAGIFFPSKNTAIKRKVMTVLFLFVWITSTPIFSLFITKLWEKKTEPLNNIEKTAQAIIILGGGLYKKAPEYDGASVVSDYTLARLHYGSFLYKKTNAPIMVTGGDPINIGVSEGDEMNSVLNSYYKIPPKWIENASANTFFNAKKSALILQKENIKRVYIVTHAWHMPRASLLFRKFGFDVIEAPTRFSERPNFGVIDFLPTADGASRTALILKEMIGFGYYSLCEICHAD